MNVTRADTTPATDREHTAAALRAAGYRVTSQRLLIHQALVELDRHVGAEELLTAVGERLPNVSLPTVYASLDALEEAGLVRRVAERRLREEAVDVLNGLRRRLESGDPPARTSK